MAQTRWNQLCLALSVVYLVGGIIALAIAGRVFNEDGWPRLDLGWILLFVCSTVLVFWHPVAFLMTFKRPWLGVAMGALHGAFLLVMTALDQFVYGTETSLGYSAVVAIVAIVGALQLALSISYWLSIRKESMATTIS